MPGKIVFVVAGGPIFKISFPQVKSHEFPLAAGSGCTAAAPCQC
ncbi:hypothetical protein ACT3UD_15740 [Glutamicibacter sp. 287]|nr:hypothetical protein [Glutamicibacter sp. BW80]